MFSFYAIAFEPFMILIICYVITKYLEDDARRKVRERVVYGYVALIVLCFIYFSPLYFGKVISYGSWHSHMWLPSWI
jgi:dolichyl-phosphate-mannose--protein O-mannosyl transferase